MTNGNEKWNYAIESEEMIYIGFSGKYISIAAKAEESFGSNEVLIFNLSGRLKGSYITEAQITAFDTSNGHTAVCINDKILLLNSRGKVVSEMDSDSNINSIKLFEHDNKVLMISEKAIMQKFHR
ncbi:MAG: DUF5711 family protein [Clostridia bacterium]|nr:DUF5711 family protein [Clostridia bacterium]